MGIERQLLERDDHCVTGEPADGAPTNAAWRRRLLDAMLGQLLDEDGLDVTVVAPAEEQSGTGDSLTEGGATYDKHQTTSVTSINVPACPVDTMGELREVPRAPELPAGVNVFESSCDLRDPQPDTDVEAIMADPSITQVPAELD